MEHCKCDILERSIGRIFLTGVLTTDSQRDFSLYFGVSHLRENLFIVDIHIKEISLVGKTPSRYCGVSLSWNFVKRGWTVI